MAVPRPYKLSILVHLPEIATEGEPFGLTYEVRNIDDIDFPGGELNVIVYLPIIGNTMVAGHPLTVPHLAPTGTWTSHQFTEKPLVSGYTVFIPNRDGCRANDGRGIDLYLSDNVTLSWNRPIGAVRARTHEEISVKQAVQVGIASLKVAIVSLVVIAILEAATLIVTLIR